ncbi:MAG: hypothetical protein J2P20_16835, partial [Pseudonocardia sp.]|nr:hypothetical protein [Pseudonocardia sp.]
RRAEAEWEGVLAATHVAFDDGCRRPTTMPSPARRVDALLDDAAATTDPARRIQDYQQVELVSNQDLALLWLSRSYLSTITKPDVKGIDRYLSRDMFYATTWLDRPNG